MFFFLVLPQLVLAQEIVVKSTATGTPVDLVFVYDQAHLHSTMSDSSGTIDLSEFDPQATLILQHPAFHQDTLYMATTVNGMKVYLRPRYIEMPEFSVSPIKVYNTDLGGKTITPEQVMTTQGYNTPEVLEQAGNIFVQRSQFGGGSPVIRGFEASRVLLVVDGIRMNNAMYRSGHLQNSTSIDQFSIAGIDLIIGPSATSFGSDALGGVVSFRTKTPPGKKSDTLQHKLSAIAQAGSATGARTMHIDYGLGQKKWGILGSLTTTSLGDLRIGSNGYEAYPEYGLQPDLVSTIDGADELIANDDPLVVTPTGYRQLDYLIKARWNPNEWWSIVANVQGSGTSEIPRYDQLNDRLEGVPVFSVWNYGPQVRQLQALQISNNQPKLWLDSLHMNLSRQYIEESRITRKFEATQEKTEVEQLNLFQWNLGGYKNLFGMEAYFGLDASLNDLTSTAQKVHTGSGVVYEATTRYPDGLNHWSSAGAFVQIKKKWEHHTWSGGMRYQLIAAQSEFTDTLRQRLFSDGISYRFKAPSGFVNWHFGMGKWSARSGIGTAFRAPNFDDYGKVREKSGRLLIPSADLVPEQVVSWDAEVGHHLTPNLVVNAGVFYTKTYHMLLAQLDQFDGQDSVLYEGSLLAIQSNQNIQQGQIYGYTAQGAYSFFTHWKVGASYNQQKGIDQGQNVPLGHIPPAFGRAFVQFNKHKWGATIATRYQGWKRYEELSPSGVDNQEEATPEGFPTFALLNIKLNCEMNNQFSAIMGCDNVLDQRYKAFASGIPGPGRNFLLTLKYTL